MRVDGFYPSTPRQDPLTRGGSNMSFQTGLYDVLLVDGVTYVCREGHVAIFTATGTSYVAGPVGEKLCAEFMKRWPRVAIAGKNPTP